MTEPPKILVAWARKTDEAQAEWARQAVDGWARTAQFSHPLNWGEAEAAVLERDYPPLPGTFVLRALGAIGVGVLALFAVPLFGSAVVGMMLVVVSTGHQDDAELPLWLARIAFVLAVLIAGSGLSMWWDTRRRSLFGVVAAAVVAVPSVVTYVVLLVSDFPTMPWLSVFVLVAGIISGIHLILELRSTPEGRSKKSRKPPKRGPRSSSKRHRAEKARARLLEVLIQRRLVDLDEGDRIRLREMPLGYWSELDGLDEREWRRVLEYRHVGWREFDPSDEQVR